MSDLSLMTISIMQCATGTALHEAALFGKVDVVNLLLQCGKLTNTDFISKFYYYYYYYY